MARKAKLPPKSPKNGDNGGKEGAKGDGKDGTPTHNSQRRWSAPATYLSPATGDSERRSQGNNASPEEPNSKKGRFSWSAKSLIAPVMDVKFPDSE